MEKNSKNRAIGIIVISLLMVSTFPVLLAENDSDKLSDDVLYARYMTYHQRKEAVVIAMDAIIDLYRGKGLNTTELTNLKVKLADLDSQAKQAAKTMNRDQFYAAVEQSRETIRSFRELVKESGVEGQWDVAKSSIQENKEYLKGLRSETSETKKGIYLDVIDNRLEKLEQISNKLEQKGADVTQINSKIEEISESRDKISEDPDIETLKSFHNDAKEDVKDLRELIKKAIAEIKAAE